MASTAREWVQWDPNPHTKAAVQALIDAGESEQLERLFNGRLEFGTAGLRAPMGLGSKAMNDLVVLQTTQGVCAYLLNTLTADKAKTMGIVVGYDHRATADGAHRSDNFGQFVAAVFLSKGFKVYMCPEVCMTPFVPFAIRHYKAAGGIMITASHNPKEDNGYKLYGANAAQIISPADNDVATLILSNLEPWTQYSLDAVRANPLLDTDVTSCFDAYYQSISSLNRHPRCGEGSALTITYTAMHGVGYVYAKRAYETFGLPLFVSTPQQQEPDPTFPTVAFPNPEEGQGALELAIQTAEANESTLILANDPDADRLAVAEKQPNGEWCVFTGNQIGALLGHWLWQKWLERNPQGDKSKVYMLASAVSSKMLKGIADKEGFRFVETLTGFKWLGNKSHDLRAQGNEVIFAFEEAIGFCCGDVVPDKDGVCGAAVFGQMAHQICRKHNLRTHLESLYDTYGRYISSNSYVKSYDSEVTKNIFAAQRNPYPATVGEYKIAHVRDLTVGYDSRCPDSKPALPLNIGGEMITYYFEGGAEVTLRTSGTEPKIKWYSEMVGSQAELDTLVHVVVEKLLNPDGNGLERRAII